MSDLSQVARFWMICRKPNGPRDKSEPKHRYSHKADALDDAARLANSSNHPFLVLEAVEIIRPGDTNQDTLL